MATNPFTDLFRAVQRCLREFDYPPGVMPESVEVPLSTGKRLILPMVGLDAVPARLNEMQRDILEAIKERGPLKGQGLAAAVGWPSKSIHQHPGGIRELVDRGLLLHDRKTGYHLPGQLFDTPAGP